MVKIKISRADFEELASRIRATMRFCEDREFEHPDEMIAMVVCNILDIERED